MKQDNVIQFIRPEHFTDALSDMLRVVGQQLIE